jgi:hypothetical protein
MGRPEGENHLEDRSIAGRMIMRWIFKKRAVEAGTRLIWFRIEQVAGFCECNNEPSVSIRCGEFLD